MKRTLFALLLLLPAIAQAQFRVDDGILDSYSSVPLNLQVGSTTQASITATGQLHVAELCDEAGANCNDISSGLGGGATPSGTMRSGWPDAISCASPSGQHHYFIALRESTGASTAIYRYPSGSTHITLQYNDNKTFSTADAAIATWDCVANAWTIDELYANGKAFNFTGPDVSATTPAAITSLTDVKTTMTPTNGQVLTWNNTASEWEAANPTGGGATASGTMISGFPDMIKCTKTADGTILYITLLAQNSSGIVSYRYHNPSTSTNDAIIRYKADGSFDSHGNMTGYDCVDNAWSVTDLYSNNAGFNFTGADVSVTAPADITALTDVKTSMTPTDGQVLTWNNTASEWEAQDAAGATASGAMISGFPDAIRCKRVSDNYALTLYLLQHLPSASHVWYRYIQAPASTTDYFVRYNTGDKSFSTHSGLSGYDCVDNTLSLTDLYAQNQAYNFTGADVSITTPADITALTDVKTTMTPTNGQVLTWNNTASEWEAADPTGGATASGAMKAGWPDAIMCKSASDNQMILHYVYSLSTDVYYRFIQISGVSSEHSVQYNPTTKAFKANSASMSAWDCVTNAWSIDDLYAQGRAYNFTGADVSITAPADITALTDVKTTMAPTDGQVLTWNNAASEWEAQDAAGATASGAIKSGWPDAIVCYKSSTDTRLVLHLSTLDNGTGSGSLVVYRYLPNPTSASVIQHRLTQAGAFNDHTGLDGYDCGDNSWSLADVYSNNRAYHFTGPDVDVSITTPADITALTDVKTSMTPTDGQVLTWNNTASEWEAADPTVTVSPTATGAMMPGWPDAIMCQSGSIQRILYLVNPLDSSNEVTYRLPSALSTYQVEFIPGTGAYKQNTNMSGYDCVTNTWSKDDFYAQGRGYNFTGPSGASALAALTDVKTSMTPTDGQVLTWNNTASEWEAADPTGAVSPTATGVMKAGWPDAIMCEMASGHNIYLKLVYVGADVYYRFNQNAGSTSEYSVLFNPADGAYKSASSSMSSSNPDCVTGTWSIADYYSNNRAYHFTGPDGAGAASIDELTDAKHDTDDYSSLFLGNGAGANDDGTNNYNVGVGKTALGANTTGRSSAAFGFEALRDTTTGSYNTALGASTLSFNTTGLRNTAAGYGALYANTTGQYNTALGSSAMQKNIDGRHNVSVGHNSLYSNESADENTAIGYYAMRYNKAGQYNTVLGSQAGAGALNATDINNNVLLGFEAGNDVRTGADNNVMIGYQAGSLTTTGANNILIGSGVQASAITASNELNIGNTIYGDLANDFVGIGVQTPTVALDVSGTLNVNQICDETGANCNDLSAGLGGGATASGAIKTGWPDAIKCVRSGDGYEMILYMYSPYNGAGGIVGYRHIQAAGSANDYAVLFNPTTKAYTSHSNMSGFDCADNTWSIEDIYSNNRAFNFTGPDVSLTTPTAITALTDVKTAMTPTDGQVLTWNNTASEWEAQDAAGATASGSISSNWPDAIKCTSNATGTSLILYLVADYSGTGDDRMYYRYTNAGTSYDIRYTHATRAFESEISLSTYDCATNAWSIDDIYAQGRGYNFTGPDASSAWLDNAGNIYRNSGNVGIGTTTPSSKLEVVHTGTVAGDSTQKGNAGLVVQDSGSSNFMAIDSNEIQTFNTSIVLRGETGIVFGTGDTADADMTEVARFNKSGFMGLGTNSPDSRLHVNGNLIVNDQMYMKRNAPIFNYFETDQSDGTQGKYWRTLVDATSFRYDVSDNSGFAGYSSPMKIKATGEVGIGTVDPLHVLHVYNGSNGTGGNGLHVGNGTEGIEIRNGTGTGYAPFIIADSLDATDSFGLLHQVPVASDTGSDPAIKIVARQVDNTSMVNRPILAVQNRTATYLTVTANGTIQYPGTLVDTSDIRLKQNVEPLKEGQLDKIKQVNTVSFQMKDQPDVTEYGVIAQELEEIYPLLVHTSNDASETKTVNYVGMIAPMLKAIQELTDRVEHLEAELEKERAQ